MLSSVVQVVFLNKSSFVFLFKDNRDNLGQLFYSYQVVFLSSLKTTETTWTTKDRSALPLCLQKTKMV